ncbi:antitoxin Xre-like helix-turn-helix domain-containing protein [Phyllobacterium leguminum]|uniref:Putative toxin-antitoxin system antitoxin component (TIGR02293 family) n=1 Tax=Phyllobacterium leguminum TaxID=314237 RepID=A0A318T1H0_9HYPH|nr:antitoxin Xre-like helix-turn-helix domain-containing protein [Phyllobacterium leguminum]PYE88371.1 putative toxin-antitoxin system antitoxin component (TIGR02293 family) [Phyllobacterium leguminum]
MFHFTDIADVLGLPASEKAKGSLFGLIDRIEEGLPVGAVQHIADLLAPNDAKFKYRLIPKATYERRKKARRLSPEEGARLVRVARVWGVAMDIWKSEEPVRRFLFRHHMMLEDKRPIDVTIQSELGAELVCDILGGLKYGTAP